MCRIQTNSDALSRLLAPPPSQVCAGASSHFSPPLKEVRASSVDPMTSDLTPQRL